MFAKTLEGFASLLNLVVIGQSIRVVIQLCVFSFLHPAEHLAFCTV